MPNWVFNNLEVRGTKENLDKFRTRVLEYKSEFTDYDQDSTESSPSKFSFHAFITPPADNLDDIHIEHVIKMLEKPADGTKAWTKKECCAYLGIAYNTTRLNTLIEKYKEKVS